MSENAPFVRLVLLRQAESAWSGVVRPWLEEGAGRLERNYVVVPTRGQAQALKQRCLAEEVALLGVEFLSPGLARKKWLALGGDPGPRPVLGRELLLLGLRAAIERRLAGVPPEDAAWGFWKSLQSDPERALDDHDDLLKAGFRAADFALPALRDVFAGLISWIESLGYDLAVRQAEVAALTPLPPSAPRISGRLLVQGLSAEMWGEFFNVAAFVRRFRHITVAVPEPLFGRGRGLDEKWVALWEQFLGVEAQALDVPEHVSPCAALGDLWVERENRSAAAACEPRVIVGRTRGDEMELVADEIESILASGGENIAVLFPAADAAHLRLSRLLTERGVAYVDLLEAGGAPPLEVELLRGLVQFQRSGARWESLFELWPLLRASGQTELPPGAVRAVGERFFDERQTHSLIHYTARFERTEDPAEKEIGRILTHLLPPWPAELAVTDALDRVERLAQQFSTGLPAGWASFRTFAAREQRRLPSGAVLTAIEDFLPDAVPTAGRKPSGFARVTLTTRRRAEGVVWSHVILAEANAGVWPRRGEASPWLTDQHRTALNERSRFSLGLFTTEHRVWLERQGYAMLARDASEEVIFSAALYDEQDPEVRLAPNSWLERVLLQSEPGASLEAVFEGRARARRRAAPAAGSSVEAWTSVWRGRRDPLRAFDDHFLTATDPSLRPAVLPVRLIERAVQDPAELWFEAVLRARRIDWKPLERARKKSLGLLVHQLMAEALRTPAIEEAFCPKPEPQAARARLQAGLQRLRERWPDDHYWASFHAELASLCRTLLDHVFALESGDLIAAELKLPPAARLDLGSGATVGLSGRVDLALFDRPGWGGATVDIVDFKTGRDPELSAERMARRGSSLQLGVYLAAARELGAARGRIWMLKPEHAGLASLSMEELPLALTLLEQVGRHLASGVYGALTRDRSEYAPPGFAWPLACTPVGEAVLAEKFRRTFAVSPPSGEEGADD